LPDCIYRFVGIVHIIYSVCFRISYSHHRGEADSRKRIWAGAVVFLVYLDRLNRRAGQVLQRLYFSYSPRCMRFGYVFAPPKMALMIELKSVEAIFYRIARATGQIPTAQI
jgi:hypothetical protein